LAAPSRSSPERVIQGNWISNGNGTTQFPRSGKNRPYLKPASRMRSPDWSLFHFLVSKY
jgi:hypothetical protein